MEAEELLRAAYRAFNGRDLEAAVALMHEDVDWPNAWEGGRVRGRDAVREYWQRQFESVSSEVDPERFEHHANGEVTVLVRQTLRDAKSGTRLSGGRVRHRYRIEDGLITRMDVLEHLSSAED
jgi:ketosteroid isomerase-like protein